MNADDLRKASGAPEPSGSQLPAPAQSDAPSAEDVATSVANSFFDIDTMMFGRLRRIVTEKLEAYAALRTAKFDAELRIELKKTLTLCDEETVIGGIRNLSQAHVLNKSSLVKLEAKVAQLERERDAANEQRSRECLCFWCNQKFPFPRFGTREEQAKSLTDHAMTCKENPIHKLTSALSEARERAQQWVKVSERLPNPEHTVLWCKVPVCEPPVIGSIEDGDFEYATDFTHWMAMPNEFWPGASGAAGKGGTNG